MISMKSAPEPKALRYLRHPATILVALAAGIGVGIYAHGVGQTLKPASDVYLFILQMTLVPILVSATATGFALLARRPLAGRLVVRVIVVLLAFLILTGGLGVLAGALGKPGSGLSGNDYNTLARTIRSASQGSDLSLSLSQSGAARPRTSLLDLLTGIVPRNVFASLSSGSVVQVMFFAIIFGLAIGLMRERQQHQLTEITGNILEAFKRVNLWLIYALPFGTVILVSYQIALSGTEVLGAVLKFLVIFGAAILLGVVLSVVTIWRRSGKPLRAVLSALIEPLTYAFITGNSLLAVPYTIRALERGLGFDPDASNAAVPVAAVFGRFGYTLYFVLAGTFIAQFYNVHLYPTDYVILVAGSAIASFGTAGKSTAASLGLMSLVLGPLGLPVEPVVIVFGAAGLVVGPLVALFESQLAMTASTLIIRRETETAAAVESIRVRRLSLRSAILVLLASLILLTGLVTIGLTYSAQRRNISYLADGMLSEISGEVLQRTTSYFEPVARTNKSLRYLLEHGIVDVHDRRALIEVMRNAMVDNPEFAAVYYGDASGNFTMVKRMPDGSLSNRLITRTADSVQVVWQHENPAYAKDFPNATDTLAQGYDPRTRGWYKEAVQTGEQGWTNVYLFASDNMLGISNALPIYKPSTAAVSTAAVSTAAASTRSPAAAGAATSSGTVTGAAPGQPIGVLAIDIGLAELSYFLGGLQVSDTGTAYILNEKNELVALSLSRGNDLSALFSGAPTGSASSTANLVLADEAKNPLVRQTFLKYLSFPDKKQSFITKVGKEKYISKITDFPQDMGFKWKIAVVLPNSQIFGYVNQTSRVVLFAAILLILVSIGLGVNFSRAITMPLHRLSRDMERIRNFDLGGTDTITSRITEIHTMSDAFVNMKGGLSAFNKYVPSKLVAELIRLGEEPKIGGQHKTLSILFSDVAGFTTISERLSPDALVEELAVYFSALGNVIMQNRGTVDKFIGDAIMAFWNAPAPVEDHAVAACLSALGCQEELRKQRVRVTAASSGRPAPEHSVFLSHTRIGVHTGEVIVGNVGSEERLNYTVLGDAVNLASRLEGLNKFYGTRIIISEVTYAAAKHVVAARLIDKVAVKGREGGIEIYELLGKTESLTKEEREFAALATEAVRSYVGAHFDRAIGLIRRARKIRPEDKPLAVLLGRCAAYRKSPPPPDWDGVYVYHEK